MELTTNVSNKMVNNDNRVTVYDWLRLIATIFVVIGHSAYLQIGTTYGGASYVLPANLSPIYYSAPISFVRRLSGWVYGFHMPLFFMLSGAVLALKPMAKFDSIVKNKAKRLLIPYFIYGWFFMLPVKRLGNFYTNEQFPLALKGFLVGEDSGHLWFLTALFWCIIAFVIIIKVLERMKISSIYAPLFVTALIYCTYDKIPFDILSLKRGLSYMLYFSIGYVFEKERGITPKWNTKKVIVACGGLLALEIINYRHFEVLNPFFTIIVGSLLTYLLADIFDRMFPKAKNSRKWNFVIKNLFYVYLLHDPLEYIVLRFFMHGEYLTSAAGCILFVLFRTIVIFFVSLMMGECIGLLKKNAKKVQ